MALVSNPKFTRKANATLVLMRISGDNYAADDIHLTVGKGGGSHSNYLARVQARFSEPDWPSSGKIVRALLTVHEYTGDQHSDWTGGSAAAAVRRVTESAGFSVPDTSDGYYTQQGTGDKYPGSSTAATEKTFTVHGAETHDVTGLVEHMLPGRIKKQDGTPCDNAQYGIFQIRSTDEDNASKSFILTREMYLSVEIKTAITPDAPLITEIIGAQDDSGPTTVGSTDGRTLEVVFAFRGAPGDTASKAELAFYGVGATDDTPGTLVRTTGSITPSPGGGVNLYRVKLTGLALGATGRFRVRATSQKGEQGDWSSLDDDDAYVQLATIPGAPLDIVFQPFVDDPHILFSLNSPDPADYVTGGQAVVTLVPQGTLAWDSGMDDIGGTTRRADLVYGGVALADGQRVSYIVRTRNAAGVVGAYSAPREQTVRELRGPTVTPDPGRVLTRRPTFTIANATFDGWRLRLLDPLDDDRVLYDSGGTAVVNQTSVSVQIPAGVLAYGQEFRVVASTAPDGSVVYGDESRPQLYSVASLPSTVLSVPDAVSRRSQVEDIEWLRTVRDPDGAAIAAIDQEIRAAGTPAGSGALITRWYDPTATPLTTVPDGDVTFESAADSRARATNDITALWATTLDGAVAAGATSATLASAASATVGDDIVIASTLADETEVRTIATLPGGNVATWTDPLEHAHASGQAVTARAFGPWSPWVTISALQPPTVDLITPADAAVVQDPTDTLDWSVTGYGGRTQASAVATIYDAAGAVLASLPLTTESEVQVPAYLLDYDATTPPEYGWDVTVTDTQGMVTTSERRTFTTLFAEPAAITVLTAVGSPETGTVALSWDEGAEPYVHNYEVTWIADDGSPVRIDGGPESLLDGSEPFTGAGLVHIGARLGENVYHVSVSNGWRSSEPVSATADLTVPDYCDGCFVDEVADRTGLVITDATLGHRGTIERHQAPGGQPRQITWGGDARSLSVGVHLVPSEDGELVSRLRNWSNAGTPVWVKLAAPYMLDPVWATLQGFPAVPLRGGAMTVDLDLLEIGDPIHAILPTVVEVPEGEGDIYVDTEVLDFGVLEET